MPPRPRASAHRRGSHLRIEKSDSDGSEPVATPPQRGRGRGRRQRHQKPVQADEENIDITVSDGSVSTEATPSLPTVVATTSGSQSPPLPAVAATTLHAPSRKSEKDARDIHHFFALGSKKEPITQTICLACQ
jgi:hypothetical protein